MALQTICLHFFVVLASAIEIDARQDNAPEDSAAEARHYNPICLPVLRAIFHVC